MTQERAYRPRDGGGRCRLVRWSALLLPAIIVLAAGVSAAKPAQAAAYIVTISGAGVTGSNPSYTLSISSGQQVTLSAVASGASCASAPNYVWIFNNAQIGSGSFIAYTFTTSGTAYVTVSDACGNSGSATLTVTIGGTTGQAGCTPNPPTGNPITVNVVAQPTAAATGQTISFTASANDSGAGATSLSFAWNFGDGVTLPAPALQTQTHAYSAANSYTVTATVTDNLGRSNCGSTAVTIGGGGTGGTTGSTNPRLTVAPNGPYTGNVNQAISFGGFAQSLNGGTVTGYTWTFGDGGTATGQTVQHTYTTAGTFTVTLSATDSTGQQSSNTTTATIGGSGTTTGGSGTATVGQNSERGVTVNTGGPYSGSAGTAINFTGTATTTNGGATIASYVWAFGDGTTSTGQTTSHAYSSSGNYTLTLTATDSTGVAVAATAVVVVGGGSASTGPRTVQLAQGCNNVALTFPDNTPSTTVASGVSPSSALLSIWKLFDPQNQKYHAFFPGATQATDLPSVNRLDAVFICVNAAATLTEPGA